MKKLLAYPTYESIDVRPLINCQGTYTIISGSVILPEVRQAMYSASQQYVHLEELMEKVGSRIAGLMQCEWGLVTNGCAAALCQITAACVAGTDPGNIVRLPDTDGMKNEVIVQPSHRHVYDHAVRMAGVKIIEAETMADLQASISDSTAMLLIFGDVSERGKVTVREMADIGRQYGIPTFVDAAAERPDIPNWYLEQGVDAVAYSGGKCLRGPQASGLVLGRKDLLQTAFLHGAPHHSLGRPMKVGKEEIMGLLAAVEQWVKRDHHAEWQEWERRLGLIGDVMKEFDSVTTSIRQPGRSNVAPVLEVSWDVEVLGITGAVVGKRLSSGKPRIELANRENGISVMPYMMEEGDAEIVADRLRFVVNQLIELN